MTTEALVFLGELDPEAIGDALEHATHYEPSPVGQAEALLDASPLDPRDATFVDLGAGMGRVMLLAARRPFRQVVGVEVSPALVEIARENLAGARDALRVVRDVRVVRADAAAYALPPGNLVVYLYNPFHGAVFDAVVERLHAAAEHAEVIVLYHTAVERQLLDQTGTFEPIADLSFGLAYRVRRGRAGAPGSP